MKYMEKRKQIISIGQEIYRQRLVAGTWGNVSCRLAASNYILITPSVYARLPGILPPWFW
jgi:ribulose-5-phosphate 4-epimerase/fuculose-1-phosphate aldolase